MEVRIEIDGPSGEHVDHVADVSQEGDLQNAIAQASRDYRKQYPDAEPFTRTIKISNA